MHSAKATGPRGHPRELLRDWRVRVLVPVILIHIIVFGGLYFLLYQLVEKEVEAAYKVSGEIMLGAVAERFEGAMSRHHFSDLEERLRRYASGGHFDLKLFDARKKLVASSGGDVAPTADAELEAALAPSSPMTAWYVQDRIGFRLNGVRPILNRASCHGCHSPKAASLGAIHMSMDLTHVMTATRQRLLFRIGLLLLAWAVLAVVMAYLRDIVIGRPIARIENVLRLINLPRRERKDSGDLETLSDRVNQAVWTLLEEKKRQDASFRQHLARAEQMAALGELAAGLTHEIRNPIAGVSSALQLMRSEETDPPTERAHLIDQMLIELDRVSKTLVGLLGLARPQPPQKAATDLAALTRDILGLFRQRLHGRNIRLAFEAPDPLPALEVDRGQLTQLVLNLLTNAEQTVRDGGSIEVRLAPFPDGGGVMLSVMDDGAGIPADQLERIWEPFYTTKEKGTGLGLAVCRQIAELHGGTITVESVPGEGARFLVLLPRVIRG
jgi:signal transduction histidine kinase